MLDLHERLRPLAERAGEVNLDLPKAATMLPSEDVNTCLQGGTGMNFLPPMSASTLTTAKTEDGQMVAPAPRLTRPTPPNRPRQ